MLDGTDFKERRKHPRVPTDWQGWVLIPGRRFGCRVIDYSEGGAKLVFNVPVGLPHRFRLVVESPRLEALCVTRHQTQFAIGVEFVACKVAPKISALTGTIHVAV